jgi:hypothetical protein
VLTEDVVLHTVWNIPSSPDYSEGMHTTAHQIHTNITHRVFLKGACSKPGVSSYSLDAFLYNDVDARLRPRNMYARAHMMQNHCAANNKP